MALVIGILLVCLVLVGPVCGAYPTEDYSKVLILHLNFSKGAVNEQSVEMQYGHPPILGLQTGDIHGSLKTSDGDVITEFDLWDPRYQLGDGVLSATTARTCPWREQPTILIPQISRSLCPIIKDQMTLDLTDKRTGTC